MTDNLPPTRDIESYKRQHKKHSSLYALSMLIGVSIAFYIYAINFDSYSETTLVRITGLWFFPLIFGYYGLLVQWLDLNYQKKGFSNSAGLLFSISKKVIVFSLIFNFVHVPLYYFQNKKPLIIAIIGSLIWVVLLIFFFEFIFPLL